MADRDYKELVRLKKAGRSALEARMDNDRKLVELAAYDLTDVNGNSVPNSISVTMNDPAVFAANVESSLGNATEQVVVESEDKNMDTAYIEDVVRAAFDSANSRLVSQGEFELNPFLDQQMCRRGRGVARCLFRMNKKTKTLICDVVPWDSRFFYYGRGPDGIEWGAYETTKSKDDIAAESWAQKLGFTIEEESAEVLDVFDREKNFVWVADEKIVEQKHPHGYPPICQQIVPMGSMMADKDSMVSKGESIFFLIRDLIPELNRLVSIIQSLNMKALDNALLWRSTEGIGATPPTHADLTTPGGVTPADIGGGAEPVNYGRLQREMYLLHQAIETRIQRGSLSSTDLGTLNFQLSAVALIQLGEGRDQVFLPRLGARGLLKQQLAKMIIDQIMNCGATSVEIGTSGHERTFDTRKLQGEYKVAFKYFIKSPQIDVARFSMAAAAGNLISDKTKRRDILQQEDPDGEELQLRWEEAERLVPTIKMRRDIKALLEMADRGDKDAEAEAKLMTDAMGATVEQMLSGSAEQIPKPVEAQKPKPLVPLFGRGGGGQAEKAAEATPRAEEGEE